MTALTLDALVEAMARAIWADRFPDRLWEDAAEVYREDFRGHARAALAAQVAASGVTRDDLVFLAVRAEHAEAGGPNGAAAFQRVAALLRALAEAAGKGGT